ncbi:hypothetical protein D3C81_1117120 [compost metagenome]
MTFNKRPEIAPTLGYPRPVIQNFCRFRKYADVNILYRDAHALDSLNSGIPCFSVGRFMRAEEMQWPPRQAELRGKCRRWRRDVAGPRVLRVHAAHGGVNGERISRCVTEHGHTVQAGASRHYAAGRPSAQAGLEADQAVQCGRHSARAGRIGAKRKRRLAAGNSYG